GARLRSIVGAITRAVTGRGVREDAAWEGSSEGRREEAPQTEHVTARAQAAAPAAPTAPNAGGVLTERVSPTYSPGPAVPGLPHFAVWERRFSRADSPFAAPAAPRT